MDRSTLAAQEWLDQRFSLSNEGRYRPHRTNADFGCGRPGFLSDLGMLLKIVMALSHMEFDSVLDVGAADGFNTEVIRRLFGTLTVASDLSSEALSRAYERYGLATVGLDAHHLPFQSSSFDLVLCNEVIEHVSDPVKVMLEVFRVARRFAVISTLEYEHKVILREARTRLLNKNYAHAERRCFTHADFECLFPNCLLMPQLQDVSGVSPFEIDDRGLDLDEAKQIVVKMSAPQEFGYRRFGVLAIVSKNETQLSNSCRISAKEVVDALFKPISNPPSRFSARQIEPALIARLACPTCGSSFYPLALEDEEIVCISCKRTYRLKGNTPLLYPQVSHDLAEIPQRDFFVRYPEVDRNRALALQARLSRLSTLPRISTTWQRLLLRWGIALINLVFHPRAFMLCQLHKLRHLRMKVTS